MFNLNQALEVIASKPEFIVRDRGSHTVIDYQINDKNTFVGQDPAATNILLSLRGTAFDNKTGEIIRLGFHKFFNYGENPQTDKLLDFDADHVITQKLDGSCIFPLYTKEGTVLGTRAGVTDVSALADEYVNSCTHTHYQDFIAYCKNIAITPIFEFCSRANRVVIDYPITQLVLIGMRCMRTGNYTSYNAMAKIGQAYSLPVVKRIDSIINDDFESFRKSVSNLIDDEGVVVRIESGTLEHHMFKMKATSYCQMHKALDNLRFAKDLIALHLNGLLDDTIPLLTDVVKDRVESYVADFDSAYFATANHIRNEYSLLDESWDQKTFALAIADHPYKHFFFKLKAGRVDLLDYFKGVALKSCSTQASAAEFASFIGLTTTY